MTRLLSQLLTATISSRHTGKLGQAIVYGHHPFRIVHVDTGLIVEIPDTAGRNICQAHFRMSDEHWSAAGSAEVSLAGFAELVNR